MRAIILAAGLGSRLRPITNEVPKSLVKVLDEPMAERQIRFLKKKGVDEIIVVTGYLKDKFDYLKDKYGVKLVYNDKYDQYNNIYTMYLVREYLEDAYVVEGDVYMNNNVFDSNISETKYFSCFKSGFENEWELKFTDDGKIEDIVIGSGDGYIMSGISYWSKSEGNFIREKLDEIENIEDFKNLYWDNLVKDSIDKLNIGIVKLKDSDLYEIDTVEELKKTREILSNK